MFMQYTKADDMYIIKLEKGEDLITALSSFCVREGIDNAHFSGIGAAENISCGYYALEEKKYYFTQYPELVEVVSLSGNVALKEGRPFIHVHGLFTDRNNQAFGGHIEHMSVGIVLEVILHVLPTSIERRLDDGTGLALFECQNGF